MMITANYTNLANFSVYNNYKRITADAKKRDPERVMSTACLSKLGTALDFRSSRERTEGRRPCGAKYSRRYYGFLEPTLFFSIREPRSPSFRHHKGAAPGALRE